MRFVAGIAPLLLVATPALADPKAECLSAVDQGQQARDDGRYRAARDAFATCSRAVCPKPVAASCTKWSREIADALPTVVLAAKDGSGGDLTDVRVTFDGAPLTTSLDGKPVEVDPGSHKLRFEREGSEPAEQTVVIKAGEKLRAITVVLRASEPVAVVTKPVEEEHPKSGGGGAGRAVATVALGVLGAGGIAAGIVFGFASQGDASTASNIRGAMPTNACVGAGATTPACQSLANAVSAENRDGTLSVVMYVAGGVLAAAAVVTWLVWPKPKEAPPPIGLDVGPTFLGIHGSF